MRFARGVGLVALAAVVFAPFASAQQGSRHARARLQQQALKQFDKDGDGKLSQDERQEARRAWRNRQKPQTKPAGSVPQGVRALRDIEYARVNGTSLRLNLFLPKKSDKPLPVVVWIHGGAWQSGNKDQCPAVPLAEQGYAVVSINYRLTDLATFPAQIHDCKAAIRWVRAHAKDYGLDPDRIGAWGSSAGGHLVALLGTSGGVKELEGDVGGNLEYSSRVQAVCDFCGPATFRREDLPGDSEWLGKPEGPKVLQKLLGGPLDENLDKARAASPVSHITKDDPPFLIVHGDKDNVVPVRQSRVLAEALKKAGVDVTLRIVPGAGHGVGSLDNQRLAKEFFDRHLKGESGPAKATHAAD